MSPQDVAQLRAQSDAFVDAIVRAYGPQRARGAVLHAVKLLLERADTLARCSTRPRRGCCPPSQS